MKISIIPQDNRIVVDGKTVDLDDNDIRWEFEDEHIHAIQWKDSMGEVEYEDEIGKDPLPNKSFGQDEFDTIVQPYLSFFEKFLTVTEQNELEAILEEEERLANDIKESDLNKMQEEENILMIEDLQLQNKEVRQNYMQIAAELGDVLEEKKVTEQQLKLEYDKELFEKDQLLKQQEHAKIEEFFKKKSADFLANLEKLEEDFNSQKENLAEEKKQFNDYIQKYRDTLEKESEEINEQLLEGKRNAEKDKILKEKSQANAEESMSIMRAANELEQQSMELAFEELELEKTRLRNERRLEIERIKLLEDELEKEKENIELSYIQEREEILKYDMKDDAELTFYQWQLKDTAELEADYIKKQQDKFDDYIAEREGTYRDIEERVRLKEIEGKSELKEIEDVSSILDEINPEEFYQSLTDDQRDSNSFPVEKATAWFKKLKEVMEKNES